MKANASPLSTAFAVLGIAPKAGEQHKAQCPAHDDGTASLSVAVKPDGTVGLHCHAGCTADAVCKALGITTADLFPAGHAAKSKPKPKPQRKPSAAKPNLTTIAPLTDADREAAARAARELGPAPLTGYKLSALYPYRFASGKMWGWRARFENKGGDKKILPFHRGGENWIAKEPPAPRSGKPLYRLPEVMASIGPVYIVEGEKCADALAAIGIAATTSGAAKSAAKADWSPLAGRTCVVWPDNDAPGEQYAADVAEILDDKDCTVSVVDVTAIGQDAAGDDAADWLAQHPAATAADVLALPTIAPQSHGVKLTRASDITPEAISWLWDGYLARGMLTLIAGNGGTGKTTIALTIAATVTTGGKWPDSTRAPTGSVIVWSGEDAIAQTLVPRLREAGADLSRVYFVTNEDQVFDPATDMPALERAARRLPDLALVIIDPIVSMVQGDSHKNAEVRRGLQPVLNLAADTGAAVVGITHYAKNTAGRSTADRVIGSVAFNAVARTVLATAMGSEGEGRIVRPKNNIGTTGDGFAYSIAVENRDVGGTPSQVSRIEWGRPLFGFADELLGQVEAKRHPKDEAAEWLSAMLHDGPVPSKELKERADADGVAWRTVERAKDDLGIVATRQGAPGKRGAGTWAWSLPVVKGVRR